MRIVAMKRKIIVVLISFATAATFNGIMQAGNPPHKNEELTELTEFMHANGAVVVGLKIKNSLGVPYLGLLPFNPFPEASRKEDNKPIPANENR